MHGLLADSRECTGECRDRNGRMRIDRIRGAALMQVALAREMAQGLGLSPRQLGLLRELRQIFVPFAAQ